MNTHVKKDVSIPAAIRRSYRLFVERIRIQAEPDREKFECPVCSYNGPFLDITNRLGFRKNSRCPKCGSFESHRLQYLTIMKLTDLCNFSEMSMLHLGPDTFFRKKFRKMFGQYTSTADMIVKNRITFKAGPAVLPFGDASFDFIFASHVLEYIREDEKALSEIRRLLKPDGVAVLPVPILAENTIEYPEPNPVEWGYVRAPGMDYHDRYLKYFSTVNSYESAYFPDIFQTYIRENRRSWPTELMPYRKPMHGNKHPETAPVCFA